MTQYSDTAKEVLSNVLAWISNLGDSILAYYSSDTTSVENKLIATAAVVFGGAVILLWLNHKFDVWEGNSRNSLVNGLLITLFLAIIFGVYIWLRVNDFAQLDGIFDWIPFLS